MATSKIGLHDLDSNLKNQIIYNSTVIKSDSIWNITTVSTPPSSSYTLRFDAPEAYMAGDVLYINGTQYGLQYVNGKELSATAWAKDASVQLMVNPILQIAFFNGGGSGGGLEDIITAEAAAEEVVYDLITESGTWTAPEDVYQVYVVAVGGGGGSYYSVYHGQTSTLETGGCSGHVETRTIDVIPGKTYTVSVGAAGSNNNKTGTQVAETAGYSAGGSSSFDIILSALGGSYDSGAAGSSTMSGTLFGGGGGVSIRDITNNTVGAIAQAGNGGKYGGGGGASACGYITSTSGVKLTYLSGNGGKYGGGGGAASKYYANNMSQYFPAGSGGIYGGNGGACATSASPFTENLGFVGTPLSSYPLTDIVFYENLGIDSSSFSTTASAGETPNRYVGTGGGGFGGNGGNACTESPSYYRCAGGGGGFCGNGGSGGCFKNHTYNSVKRDYTSGGGGGGLYANADSSESTGYAGKGGAGWLCNGTIYSGGAGFLPAGYGAGACWSDIYSEPNAGCVLIQYAPNKLVRTIQDYIVMLPEDRVGWNPNDYIAK